jgi:hypothetical protein
MDKGLLIKLAKLVDEYGSLRIERHNILSWRYCLVLEIKHKDKKPLDDFVVAFGYGNVGGFAPYKFNLSGYLVIQIIDFLMPYLKKKQVEFKRIRQEFFDTVTEFLEEKKRWGVYQNGKKLL